MYKNQYSELSAFESTQVSLMQSYRGIFISTQSILLSVATFVASQPQGSYYSLMLVIPGVCLSVLWFIIDSYKGLDAAFFDSCLLRHEEGENTSNVFSNYFDWVKKTHKEKIEFLRSGSKGDLIVEILNAWFSTRGVMGKLLPVVFTALWITLAVLVFVKGVK